MIMEILFPVGLKKVVLDLLCALIARGKQFTIGIVE